MVVTLKGKDMASEQGSGKVEAVVTAETMALQQLMASFVGNLMEFYDFSLYSGMAEIIADRFFLGSDDVRLRLSYTIFGLGFAMRPLGGIIIGKIGDTYGRKRALEVSIWAMAVPSLCMGLLPAYSQAKEWATMLLILCRMTQGLSSGGELPGIFTHLYESDNTGGICKSVGFAICGAHVGASLGLLVIIATRACLSDDEMHAYGWRIPFLTNIVVGGMGIWIRRKLRNSPSFTAFSAQVAAGNAHSKTVKEIWLASWRPIVAMLLATGAWGPVFYVCFIWMTAYQHDIVSPNLKDARATTLVVLLLLAVLTPYAGAWVDRQVAGSKDMHRALSRWLLRAWALLAVVSMPAFLLISRGGVFLSLLGQLMLVPSVAVAGSVTGALLASSFSISSRYVSTGITYNLGQCLFSSSSLVVVTAMAQDWATWTPGLYVSLVALTSAVSLYAFQGYVADCRDANTTAEEVRADRVKREAAPMGRRGRGEGEGTGAGEPGGDSYHLPSSIVNPMADLDSELDSPSGP